LFWRLGPDVPDELYVGRGAFDVELMPYEIKLLLLWPR